MNQLFGISHHSLTTFYDTLEKACEKLGINKSKISIIENHTAHLTKNDILIFVDFATLFKFRQKLAKRKSLVFVLDAAVVLFNIQDIEILDMKGNKEVSYRFYPQPLTVATLTPKLKPLTKSKPLAQVANSVEKFEVIAPLIATLKSGKILDKMNNILYRSTDATKRNEIRAILISVLSGTQPLSHLKNLDKFIKRGLGVQFIQEFEILLKSNEGKNMISAINFIVTSANKTPPKASIVAKKYGVEEYELNYLVSLFRKNSRSKEFVPAAIHKVSGLHKPRRVNKNGTVV